MPGYTWVSLTTDYGLADGFVAACHGVIARLAPSVRVIDVTHLVPAGDIRKGSAVLAQTLPHLPESVHVAVVDPGVGTARRAIAIETSRGVLVGPDNGLLPKAADALGGATAAVALTNADWHASAVSATFHGRDIFAPVAARLALGQPLLAAGHPVEPATLVRLPAPHLRTGDGVIEAEVVTVDHFGNVQLAAPGPALDRLGQHLTVAGAGAARTTQAAVRAAAFAGTAPGRLVAYVDSAGMVALAINGGSAAQALGVRTGDVLTIVDG